MDALEVYRTLWREGYRFSYRQVETALVSVDCDVLWTAEAAHWSVAIWDGQGDPPVGSREHWLHNKDAHGIAAQEAVAAGHLVYWILRDGRIHAWQPYAYVNGAGGRIWARQDPDHPDHWKKVTKSHLDHCIEQQVTPQIVTETLRWLVTHEDPV